MNRPDAILTADWHLRDTVPICRKDDYWLAQMSKLVFVRNLSEKHSCPILHAGDFFNKAKSSQFLEAHILRKFSFGISLFVCPGNHDLPNHNLNLLPHSSLEVLRAANTIDILKNSEECYWTDSGLQLYAYPWGSDLKGLQRHPRASEGTSIALVHHLISKGEDDLWKGAESEQGKALLKKCKGFDLILTGHNHKAFVVEYKNRLLVNPGSLMRMSADQANYKPRVYLWYKETNSVEPVYLPIEKDVITREHIETQEKRDQRMEAFVSRLNDNYEIGLSFEKNLENFFNENRVRKPVKELVWEMIESDRQSQR